MKYLIFIFLPFLAFGQSETKPSPKQLYSSGASTGQVLKYNGTNWVPGNDSIGVGGSSITYSTTAPTDTLTTWVYTGATVLKIWEVRKYINGAWRTFEWYDRVANFASPQPPLFVLATGQSNMEGFGTPATDTAYDYRVSVWDSTLVKWKTAMVGTNPITGNSPAFHFAKALAKEGPGRIVRLIHIPKGSQSISAWSPYGAGAMWNSMAQRITTSGTTNVDVMLWHQGEADAAWTNQRYIDSFTVIINNLRTNSWFGNKPIIVGGLVPGSAPGQTIALEQIAKNNAFVGFADASYLTHSGVHFIETQYPELGRRYYNAWKGKDVTSWDRISDNIFTSKTVLINYLPNELATTTALNIKGAINLTSNDAFSNLIIGKNALPINASGTNDIAIGLNAQALSTNQSNNITIGNNTLSIANPGGNNTTVGNNALKNCNGCSVNVGVGNNVMQNCTSCSGMVVLGFNSASNVTSGSYSFIAGQGSAQSLTTGSELIVMGVSALKSVTSQSGDIAIGSYALEKCVANDNTAVGRQALRYQTTPIGNTGIGFGAATNNITGLNLLAAGANALSYNGPSDNNTSLGAESFNSFNSLATLSVSLVDPATEKLTIGAHGFTTGTYHIFKFNVVSGTVPGGLLNNLIFVALVTSSTEIQLTQQNITDAGSGVFTVNTKSEYSNSSAVGYDSEPTASNQVVFGNTNVTQLLSTGGLYLSNSSNTNYLAGSVGIGVVPTAKLHISTGVSNIIAIQRLQNTSGDIDLFVTSGTPESVITGNVGDIAYNVTGAPYYKKTGSGNTGWKTLDPQSITLDEAYNNFGATASKITIDAAESQTGGLVIESTTADNFTVNLASTGDFNIQDNGTQFAQFGDNGNVGFGINAQSANKLAVQQSASGTQVAVLLRNGVDEDGQGIALDLNNAGIVHGRIVATNPTGSLTSALDLMTPDNSGTLSSFHTMQRDGSQNQLHKAIYYDVYSGTSTTETLTGLVTLVNIPSTATTTTINLPEIVSGVPSANQVNIGYILELSIENASAITIQRSGSSDVIMVDGATSTVTSVATTGGTYYVKRYIAVELNKWIVF